jgi:N-acetylglucosaminyldiphosphoundecaprenol N-acetyl-beta-D-mannosaminyltransferase
MKNIEAKDLTEIAGLPISRLDFSATMETICDWLGEAESHRRIATVNLDFLRMTRSNSELRAAIRSADLCTADGWPLVFLARLRGRAVSGRVAGSDLTPALLERCAQEGRRVFFLGGAPGTAEGAAQLARQRYPSLLVAGAEGPKVDLDDAAAMKALSDRIRRSAPHLLFVGLGCPKQELFLRDHLEDTGARVGIGVGGSFDFLSGRRARAPRWCIALRAEWLWRAALEPRRLASRYLACLGILPGLAWGALRSGRP